MLTDGGAIPTSPDEWLEAAGRPRYWLCARTLQAIAAGFRTDILIWEWRRGRWRLPCRFPGNQPTAGQHLCLVLEREHFLLIEHDAAVVSWKRLLGDDPPLGWRGRGGMYNDHPGAPAATPTRGRRRPGGTPNTGRTPCRNGPSCSWLQAGSCRYYHGPGAPEQSA